MESDAIRRKVYSWHAPYEVTLGKTWTRFLNGLKEKKILGNICPDCGGLHVPARPFCDKCLKEPQEWVETDGLARLETFTVAYVKFMGLPDPPFATGLLKVGNSVTNLAHIIAGVDYDEPQELEEKIKIGMTFKPVWKEERIGDMFDIAYFEPA